MSSDRILELISVIQHDKDNEDMLHEFLALIQEEYNSGKMTEDLYEHLHMSAVVRLVKIARKEIRKEKGEDNE